MSLTASHEIEVLRQPRSARALWLLAVLALPLSALFALGFGRFEIAPYDVLSILLANVLPIEPTWPGTAERVVELIRMPRVLSAMIAGAALGVTGAALQGIFRNPLVGPQIIGVTSGAAFGGALSIFFFSSALILIGSAFAFGLLAVAIVYALARVEGQAPVLTLVLAGVVVSAAFSSLISLLTYLADPNDTLAAIVYWLMGSFATASYSSLLILASAAAIGVTVLWLMRFRINVLSLGDEEAAAMGISVERSRWLILGAVAMAVSGIVSVAGIVGWVGLVVPHIARMIVGPDHRVLLPASAIFGAIYLLMIDTVARTATAAEIPLGILTALIGAPVFAIMLRRLHLKGWGRA
ncbi:iron chelate uptake ABC transporter family permease subunit [Roseobacter sp. HKCCD9010]|uniref:FecCD family ABC transporter permease n=1 Tax=unclassified Roseobacter TaxID=196798 RepID=UPI0014918926|nr:MULTISPECIES: iron ABC transporter permease [unclassified Roseobacter]MBF9052522.1 iron chelate uptake ABC transporter family permease subunit [Rhodobacterales bacterium HKCCD4356]NNV14457.1 iron chelate uptake ABC transporter family permease subunit [Roseobacter sp. HKCCD7357]NNV18723.1 iron chelate uptake ABC transporter family permease subunit [Roseobacter sp. HKCCD8768]NNV28138.1 iron chelate uptake ABC transporter family permease subunit [Roseobacter sp. HKCCD8192]NNV32451.1 iron chela